MSTRSVLFPTRTMITSLPRSVRTSSIHFDVFRKDWRPKTRQTSQLIFHETKTLINQKFVIIQNKKHVTKRSASKLMDYRNVHTCNIKHNDSNRGIPYVAGNETPESFLSSRIPVRKNIMYKVSSF